LKKTEDREAIPCKKYYRYWASFNFTLHLAENGQRHPAADLRGYKPLLQFTIFSSNKSVGYFYLKMKDADFRQ